MEQFNHAAAATRHTHWNKGDRALVPLNIDRD
jgi:hypothetical protein